MGISSVTRNYQVTIPKDVREIQGIKIGDKLIFSIEGDKVEVFKMKKEIAEKAFGSWKKTGESGTEYVRKIRKEWDARSRGLGI